MGYLEQHCKVAKLSSEIINQCHSYACSLDADIDSFFHDNTDDNYNVYLNEKMGITHCFYTDTTCENQAVDDIKNSGIAGGNNANYYPIQEKKSLVCAFTLSSSSIRVDRLPSNTRNRFNRPISNSIRKLSQFPAVLIGQLCVFDGFGRNTFGYDISDEMMDFIKSSIADPENNVAARFLFVDAINTPKVIDYYKRNKFKFLFKSDSEELEYLRGKEVEKRPLKLLFRKCFCKEGINVDDSCKTRLMYFDLRVIDPKTI